MPKAKILCPGCGQGFSRNRALRRHRCPPPCPSTSTVAEPLPDAVPPPQSPTPIVTESPRPSASTFELPSPQAPPNDFELPPQLPTSTAAEPSVQPPPQPVTEPLRPSQVFNVASPSTPDLVLGPPSDSDLFDAETDLGEMETDALTRLASPLQDPLSPMLSPPTRPPPDWRDAQVPSSFPFHSVAHRGTQTGDAVPADASTQTPAVRSPLSSVRRQVLQGRPEHEVQLICVPRRADQSLSCTPGIPSNTWDTSHPRPLCDCTRCVRHLADLLAAERGRNSIHQSRLRFHSLPGLNLRPASTSLLRRVQERFAETADSRLLACGCHSCHVHRQFVAAWRTALDLARQEAAGAQGSCPPRGHP